MKKLDLKQNQHVRLILGGSNSLYSLSSEQLEQKIGIRVYNASVLYEGFSTTGFRYYVDEIAQMVHRYDVKIVIYSTVLPYKKDKIKNQQDKIYDKNNMKMSLKPATSIFERLEGYIEAGGLNTLYANLITKVHELKNYFKSILLSIKGSSSSDIILNIKIYIKSIIVEGPKLQPAYTIPDYCYYRPNAYGDLDFSNIICDDSNIQNWFDPDLSSHIVSNFFNSQAELLRKKFPNAKIFLVLPSMLADEQAEGTMSNWFASVQNSLDVPGSHLIVQPFIHPSQNFLCDAAHHLTVEGRLWRTHDLYERMEGII